MSQHRIPKVALEPLVENNRALGMTLHVAREQARKQYIKEVIWPRFKQAADNADSALKKAKEEVAHDGRNDQREDKKDDQRQDKKDNKDKNKQKGWPAQEGQ